MASIAIIGTPAAGKTVFLSVLAMRYRIPTDDTAWLEYTNTQTQKYVTDAWDTLTNRQGADWPASTPAGFYSQLEWLLHTPDKQTHTLRVRDPAGQDILAAFDSAPESLTEIQRDVRQVIESADLVIFLVNLRPIIDAPNMRQIDQVEIPLKLALERVLTRKSKVAFLLTQHDGIADFLAAENAAFSDPALALRQYLPQLGGLLRKHPGRVDVLYVAAVAETQAVNDPDGKTYRRPKQGFKSTGLKEAMSWIETKLTAEQMALVAADNAVVARGELEEKIVKLRKVYNKQLNRRVILSLIFTASLSPIAIALYHFDPKSNNDIVYGSVFLTISVALAALRYIQPKLETGEMDQAEKELAACVSDFSTRVPVGKERTIDIKLHPRIFTRHHICNAAFLGGPFAGCWALALNYRTFKRPAAFEYSLVAGLLGSIMLSSTTIFGIPALNLKSQNLPSGFIIIGLMSAAILFGATGRLQQNEITQRLSLGAKKRAPWSPLVIALGTYLAWIILFVFGSCSILLAMNMDKLFRAP